MCHMTDGDDRGSDTPPRPHPPGVPKTPEDAQALLFMRLGSAIAQAQIAEGQAATIYRLVHHREPPRRATLGAKVREIKLALPASPATEYQLLVDARNYLAHEVLFDCGGWSGIPEIDPPNKYAQLYAAIDRAHLTIQRVSDLLSQHLVDAGYPVLIAKLSADGVTVLAPSREGPVEPAG